MDWNVDVKRLIELLGRTIYRPENVLVEIAANSYDADSSQVRIISSGNSNLIRVLDDGIGMDRSDLEILVTIAKSTKKDFVEQGLKTQKYQRKYLGSFGIGIISFLSLGNHIKIFTKKDNCTPLFIEITRVVDPETGKTTDIPISTIQEDNSYNMHLINGEKTVSGTTIEIENTQFDFSDNYELLRYKLANLPLSDRFKITLNNSEVKREDYPSNCWENSSKKISLEDIDPSYVCPIDLHLYYNIENKIETLPQYKRGIFLRVHGRVIEHNLFQIIRPSLTSPGAIDARITGFIEADFMFNKIQANREDFFENKIINKICEKLKPITQEIINDYLMLKELVSEEEYLQTFRESKEKAVERIQNIHQHLDKFGLKFKYSPTCEQELVVIISELCHKSILDFNIIQINSGSHIDCLVQWPIAQSKRLPDFVGHLEIETQLHKFFLHKHDFRTKPEICCWEIDKGMFDRVTKKYISDRPESIESVILVDPSPVDMGHFKHQKEIRIKIRTKHDEYQEKVLRVYVVSEIIKSFQNSEMVAN